MLVFVVALLAILTVAVLVIALVVLASLDPSGSAGGWVRRARAIEDHMSGNAPAPQLLVHLMASSEESSPAPTQLSDRRAQGSSVKAHDSQAVAA